VFRLRSCSVEVTFVRHLEFVVNSCKQFLFIAGSHTQGPCDVLFFAAS
jgi:hypothetical protein